MVSSLAWQYRTQKEEGTEEENGTNWRVHGVMIEDNEGSTRIVMEVSRRSGWYYLVYSACHGTISVRVSTDFAAACCVLRAAGCWLLRPTTMVVIPRLQTVS